MSKLTQEEINEWFWDLVEQCNWKTNKDYEQIYKFLKGKLSKEECELFRDTFRKHKSRLYKILDCVVKNLGDDSFDDLLSHIIGLGEDYYSKVVRNPLLAKTRAENYDFEESFAYCIPFPSDYKKQEQTNDILFEDVNRYINKLSCCDFDDEEEDLKALVEELIGIFSLVKNKEFDKFLKAENRAIQIKNAIEDRLNCFSEKARKYGFSVSLNSNSLAMVGIFIQNLYLDVKDRMNAHF